MHLPSAAVQSTLGSPQLLLSCFWHGATWPAGELFTCAAGVFDHSWLQAPIARQHAEAALPRLHAPSASGCSAPLLSPRAALALLLAVCASLLVVRCTAQATTDGDVWLGLEPGGGGAELWDTLQELREEVGQPVALAAPSTASTAKARFRRAMERAYGELAVPGAYPPP